MAKNEILTGISYYQYHFLAALTFSGYSLYHYFYDSAIISLILGMTASLILLFILFRSLGKNSELIQQTILCSIIFAIFTGCYSLGLRGVVWLFPLVISVFFNYSKRHSLIISVFSVLVGLSLATNSIDTVFAIRMLFPLSLTIWFAYLYRVTIEKEQNALEKEANEDYLTGISNRRSFHNWLHRAIPLHQKVHLLLAVFYLDLDDFKQINDKYGHEFGDRILKEVSARMVSSIRSTDVLAHGAELQFARIAGDEFVIAAAHIEFEQDVDVIARRLLEAVNSLLDIDSVEFSLSCSIGVAICQNSQMSADDLLHEADAAMYRSKELGKNRITYFDQDIADQIAEKQTIARGIEEALRKQAFFLNYMPFFHIKDGQPPSLAGAEVLIRCKLDALAGVGPDKYIPIAEEFGTIKAIDLYVVSEAFQSLSKVINMLPDDFILSINISAKELHNDSFPEQLDALAVRYAIPPSLVALEITETSLMPQDDKSIAMLKNLKDLGFNLSLDDFGTGYTAFSQLHKYPVDTLKIDRSFIWNISEQSHDNQTMVDVILSLAKLYQVKVVAEGVENQIQLDYLTQANCDYFQGFYLSKPLLWNKFYEEFLVPQAKMLTPPKI
jgi:diguanylate cyclase